METTYGLKFGLLRGEQSNSTALAQSVQVNNLGISHEALDLFRL